MAIKTVAATALATTLMLAAPVASGDPLMYALSGYKAVPGLTAAAGGNVLTVTWDAWVLTLVMADGLRD